MILHMDFMHAIHVSCGLVALFNARCQLQFIRSPSEHGKSVIDTMLNGSQTALILRVMAMHGSIVLMAHNE